MLTVPHISYQSKGQTPEKGFALIEKRDPKEYATSTNLGSVRHIKGFWHGRYLHLLANNLRDLILKTDEGEHGNYRLEI